MLLIVVAAAAVVGLSLLIATDAGSAIGLDQMQTAQFVVLAALLVFIAGRYFLRRRRQLPTALASIVLWAVIFGVALTGYAYRDDLSGVAARVFGELVPGAAVVDETHGTATFRSGIDGHFQINATVDGTPVRTIFDTGASAVVLTAEDARRVGLDTRALTYDMPVSTANGIGRAAVVTLDTIEVGGIVRHNVRAFVAEAGALDTSLLGMSFLGTLSSYSVSSNALQLTD